MKKLIIPLLVLSGFCYSQEPEVQPKQKIVINIPEDFSFPLGQEVFTGIAYELYRELDVDLVFGSVPPRRFLKMLARGEMQSDIYVPESRIKSSNDFIIVPEPFIRLHAAKFCIERNLCKNGNDLVLSKGFDLGSDYCFTNKISCSFVESDTSAFVALKKRMSSSLLTHVEIAAGLVCSLGFDKVYYKRLPELDSDSFHVVSKDLASLVPNLNEEILTLKRTGAIDFAMERFWQALYDCNVVPIDVDEQYLKTLEELKNVDSE